MKLHFLGLFFLVTPVSALTKLPAGVNFKSSGFCPVASDIRRIPFSNQKLENGIYKADYLNQGLFNSTHVLIKVKDQPKWVQIKNCGSISYSEWIEDKIRQKERAEAIKKRITDSFQYLNKGANYLSELISSEKFVGYWAKRVDELTAYKISLEQSIKAAKKSGNVKLAKELTIKLWRVTSELNEAHKNLIKSQRNLKRLRNLLEVADELADTSRKVGRWL